MAPPSVSPLSGHRAHGRTPFYLYGEQQMFSGREGWEGKEKEDGLYLRFDMPGVGKENIKVRFKGEKLVMKGRGEKDFEDCEFGPAYNYSMRLLELHLYDTKAFRFDMVNGVLKVFVPKL